MTQETLESLDSLFEENNYDAFIENIESHVEDLTYNEEEAYLPKLALSYFHTEKYNESTELFEKLCKSSQDSVLWFNLCTSAILAGKANRGLEALNTAIKNNNETKTDGEGIPTPFMLFYATRALIDAEKYNLAFNQLNELAEIYGSVSITDSHFLFTRGIPFFSEFLNIVEVTLPKQTVLSNVNDWVDYLSSRVDEDGQSELIKLKLRL